MYYAKKGLIGYFLWIVFTVLICFEIAAYLVAGVFPMCNLPPQLPVTILAVSASFLVLLGVFFLCRFLAGKMAGSQKKENHFLKIILPILILLGGVARLVVYILQTAPIEIQDGTFYYQAVVTNSRNSLIFAVHGLSELYLQLLHSIFLVFGNQPMAGIVLQILFYFSSLVLIFFAVKMLAGQVAACTAMAFLAFLPDTIVYTLSLKPEMFGLFFYASGLWLTALIVRAYQNKHFHSVKAFFPVFFAGIYFAFLIYLDLFYVSLLFFTIGLLAVRSFRHALQNAFMLLLFELLGIAAGIGIILGVLASAGQAPLSYLQSWANLYFQKIDVTIWSSTPDTTVIGSILLLCFSFFIIPGFLLQKYNKSGCFMMTLFAVLAIPFFSMNYMDYQMFTTMSWSILAGIGLQSLCSVTEMRPSEKEEKDVPKQEEEIPPYENLPEDADARDLITEGADSWEAVTENEVTNAEEGSSEVQETIVQEQPAQPQKPVPLHNPLPLPKKHVKKEMNYQHEIPQELMKYDIDVADNDDFDLQ